MNIMILGAGVMQIPAIKEAKKMGLFVLCADGNPDALGKDLCDIFYPVDIKDKAGLLNIASKFHNKHGLNGVFTAGTDFSASVAFITEKLNLPGIPYQAALNATDKFRMRTKFRESGIPSPNFTEYTEDMDLLDSVEKLSFPVVVKPVDSMGARGVMRVDSVKDLKEPVLDAIKHSRTKRVIIEEFIEGPEFSIDALVVDGDVKIFGFADRKITFEPYFVEMGHTMPSNICKEDRDAVIKVFSDAVKSLGISYGSAKGDMKFGKNGPVVGEIAARLSGGYMSGWTYPYSSEVNLTKGGLELALGKPLTVSDKDNSGHYSAERAFISIPGVVSEVITPKRKSKNIKDVFIGVKKDEIVQFPINNVEKCGNVLSLGKSYDDAVKFAEKAASEIIVRLKPNVYSTQKFLFDNIRGYAPLAFDLKQDLYDFLDEDIETENGTVYITRIDKVLKSRKKDWQGRTVSQVIKMLSGFYNVEFIDEDNLGLDFYKALINGSLQGVLYYLDGLEI